VLELLLICTGFCKAFALCSKHTELAWQSSGVSWAHVLLSHAS
jgi:hypothetical protein